MPPKMSSKMTEYTKMFNYVINAAS